MVDHISQFYMVVEKLQVVHMHHDREDSISCKFGKHGSYSTNSTYKVQFLGHISFAMTTIVWRHWALPKCKICVLLVLQNLVWTADRLQNMG
jgi:hypothetical protein